MPSHSTLLTLSGTPGSC